MIFVFVIVLVFVGASIYFFFRAESLQRALNIAKRDNSKAQKSAKALQEALALTAKKNEEFAKHRIEKIKANNSGDESISIIMPLINNYAVIYAESLKGKGRLKGICKKCFDTYDSKGFNEFCTFMKTQEKSLQRFWSSDNLNGYISLIEALLLKLESSSDTKNSKAS